MAFFLRSVSFLLLCAALTACSPLQELKESELTQRDDFYTSLAFEYLAFAESESGQEREEVAEYFAVKGLAARDRKDVQPERPRQLDIASADDREDAQGARKRLLHLRNDFLKRVSSRNLARAQVLYDCWVFQTAAKEPVLAEPCRQGFLAEIHVLEAVEASRKERELQSLPVSFTLYFASGSARLDRDAYYVIDQVRQLIRHHPDYSVDVTGHTDSVGPADRNLALSQKRAEAVTQALTEAGGEAERITTAWLGEDDPQTPALDETPRRENRRVEIDVDRRRETPAKQGQSAEE